MTFTSTPEHQPIMSRNIGGQGELIELPGSRVETGRADDGKQDLSHNWRGVFHLGM